MGCPKKINEFYIIEVLGIVFNLYFFLKHTKMKPHQAGTGQGNYPRTADRNEKPTPKEIGEKAKQ